MYLLVGVVTPEIAVLIVVREDSSEIGKDPCITVCK